MTDADARLDELIARARELEAQGYERASVVDVSRQEELLELYAELGQDVVVLDGAVPESAEACSTCLGGPGLVTFFVKRDRGGPD